MHKFIPTNDVNLHTFQYSEKFNCQIGLSDHTVGEISAITSIGLGSQL